MWAEMSRWHSAQTRKLRNGCSTHIFELHLFHTAYFSFLENFIITIVPYPSTDGYGWQAVACILGIHGDAEMARGFCDADEAWILPLYTLAGARAQAHTRQNP